MTQDVSVFLKDKNIITIRNDRTKIGPKTSDVNSI